MATPDTNNMNKVRDALMMVAASLRGTKINAQELLTELNKYNEVFSLVKVRISDVAATIKVMDQNMQTLTATYRMAKDGLDIVTVAEANVAALDKQIRKTAELAAATRLANQEARNELRRFERNVPRIPGIIGADPEILKRASIQDFGSFETASQRLAQTMAINKVSMDETRRLWTSMSTGTPMGPMNEGLKQVHASLLQVSNVWDRINSKEQIAIDKVNALVAAHMQQIRAQSNILGISSTLGINQDVLKQANLTDFTRLQTAQNQLAQTMSANKISMAQMQVMWQSMVTRSPMGAMNKESQEV